MSRENLMVLACSDPTTWPDVALLLGALMIIFGVLIFLGLKS